MRPHVLRLPQPPARERTLQRPHERGERAVAVVVFDLELAELWQRSFAGHRIFEIDLTGAKQIMSFTADVTDLAGEAMRQLPLNQKIPVFIVAIFAIPVDPLGTGTLILEQSEKGSERVREVGDIRRRKCKPGRGTLMRVTEVIVLVRAVVHTKSRADGCLPIGASG